MRDRRRGAFLQLPAPSFVSMVDAALCAVSVIIVLIVVIPRLQSVNGHQPQADLVVSCSLRTPFRFAVSAADPEGTKSSVDIDASQMDTPTSMVLIQQLVVGRLREIRRLSTRVAVIAAPQEGVCRDTILCALARRTADCPLTGVATDHLWRDEGGQSFPILTIRYGDPLGDRKL